MGWFSSARRSRFLDTREWYNLIPDLCSHPCALVVSSYITMYNLFHVYYGEKSSPSLSLSSYSSVWQHTHPLFPLVNFDRLWLSNSFSFVPPPPTLFFSRFLWLFWYLRFHWHLILMFGTIYGFLLHFLLFPCVIYNGLCVSLMCHHWLYPGSYGQYSLYSPEFNG